MREEGDVRSIRAGEFNPAPSREKMITCATTKPAEMRTLLLVETFETDVLKALGVGSALEDEVPPNPSGTLIAEGAVGGDPP